MVNLPSSHRNGHIEFGPVKKHLEMTLSNKVQPLLKDIILGYYESA